jgi:hypothetical protein
LKPTDFSIVSKLEAAERQLDMAIRLFFKREDAVSVHTLAAAAYQIITDICKQKGIERELEDSEILDEFGVKRELLAQIRRPQNFFKHADNDIDGQVKLKPMQTALFIMSSAQYLLRLRAVQSPECEVYRIWFILLFPESIPLEARKKAGFADFKIRANDYEFFSEEIARLRSRIAKTSR